MKENENHHHLLAVSGVRKRIPPSIHYLKWWYTTLLCFMMQKGPYFHPNGASLSEKLPCAAHTLLVYFFKQVEAVLECQVMTLQCWLLNSAMVQALRHGSASMRLCYFRPLSGSNSGGNQSLWVQFLNESLWSQYDLDWLPSGITLMGLVLVILWL